MAREWILNSMMNRFQLNYKRNVGPTSASIRECEPRNKDEWANYYFSYVKSREHIERLGEKLYIKITEVLPKELEDITEQHCIDYIFEMVIDRTYAGYQNEIRTIYGQLEKNLACKILPSPDEWDRLFNIDFYIKIDDKCIGLQIKPVDRNIQLPQIHKERMIAENTHAEWTKKFGGKVFFIYSMGVSNNKTIVNKEVVKEIADEMKRLKS